jgi:hypothetical protein
MAGKCELAHSGTFSCNLFCSPIVTLEWGGLVTEAGEQPRYLLPKGEPYAIFGNSLGRYYRGRRAIF